MCVCLTTVWIIPIRESGLRDSSLSRLWTYRFARERVLELQRGYFSREKKTLSRCVSCVKYVHRNQTSWMFQGNKQYRSCWRHRCDLVEELYDAHGARVVATVAEALARAAREEGGRPSDARPGARAAELATQQLIDFGVAIYAGPCSVRDLPPHAEEGPRFYVSVAAAARRRLAGGCVPRAPRRLARALRWRRAGFVRGLGWTLVPPRSEPQSLHADLWRQTTTTTANDATHFAHLIWKRDDAQLCMTEVARGTAPSRGQAAHDHYKILAPVARSPRVLFARATFVQVSSTRRTSVFVSKSSWFAYTRV